MLYWTSRRKVKCMIKSYYHSNCAATDSHDPLMRGRPIVALAHGEFGQDLAATEKCILLWNGLHETVEQSTEANGEHHSFNSDMSHALRLWFAKRWESKGGIWNDTQHHLFLHNSLDKKETCLTLFFAKRLNNRTKSNRLGYADFLGDIELWYNIQSLCLSHWQRCWCCTPSASIPMGRSCLTFLYSSQYQPNLKVNARDELKLLCRSLWDRAGGFTGQWFQRVRFPAFLTDPLDHFIRYRLTSLVADPLNILIVSQSFHSATTFLYEVRNNQSWHRSAGGGEDDCARKPTST